MSNPAFPLGGGPGFGQGIAARDSDLMVEINDPRAIRARELSEEIARYSDRLQELSVERRALLAALRDAGYPMGAIASAVGIARQNVYAILGPIKPEDQRKRGPQRGHSADAGPGQRGTPGTPAPPGTS